jgi:hypothetical protein
VVAGPSGIRASASRHYPARHATCETRSAACDHAVLVATLTWEGFHMRRLPFELYGASALMAAAIALLVRAWQRERSSVRERTSRWYNRILRRAA